MNYQYTYEELERMASCVFRSKIFGYRSEEEALVFLLVGQADGGHPIRGCTDYYGIDEKVKQADGKFINTGKKKLSLKAEVAQSRFLDMGGSIKWLDYSDVRCSAEFSIKGSSLVVEWDIDRARRAGLMVDDPNKKAGNYQKYTRPMLASRVIAEGVRKLRPSSGIIIEGDDTQDTNPSDATVNDDSAQAQQESQQAAQDAKKKAEEELAAKQQKDLLIKQLMEIGLDTMILRDKRNANGWKSSADMSIEDVNFMLKWANDVKEVLNKVPRDVLNKELLDRKWSLSSMDVAKIREMFSSYFERQPGDDDHQEQPVEG